jgi:hypothetical protein
MPFTLEADPNMQHFVMIFSFICSSLYIVVCPFAGIDYPSGASEFTTCFSGVRGTQSLVLCVDIICRSLFVIFILFLLTIVLSVLLRFTHSDYPFSIIKFICWRYNANVSNTIVIVGLTYPSTGQFPVSPFTDRIHSRK